MHAQSLYFPMTTLCVVDYRNNFLVLKRECVGFIQCTKNPGKTSVGNSELYYTCRGITRNGLVAVLGLNKLRNQDVTIVIVIVI